MVRASSTCTATNKSLFVSGAIILPHGVHFDRQRQQITYSRKITTQHCGSSDKRSKMCQKEEKQEQLLGARQCHSGGDLGS